ncbi:oleate hydratase, partial [Staphylococcus epidermidis]|uniref:oleate hydratase n=1 Tax=Staphylococcus epidermidis TaxID=1282 RepID=UPI00164355B3
KLHISDRSFHPINIHHHPFLLPPPTQIQNHFQSLSHFFTTIPSLQQPHPSLLHQFYSFNNQHPNYSKSTPINTAPKPIHTHPHFTLSKKPIKQILTLSIKKQQHLQHLKISQLFTQHFLNSNFS